MKEQVLAAILQLTEQVHAGTRSVSIASNDCAQLGRLVKSLGVLIHEARSVLASLPREEGVEPACIVLQDGLTAAKALLPKFDMPSHLCAVVRAGVLKSSLLEVANTLAMGVDMLPAVEVPGSWGSQAKLDELSHQFRCIQCTMLEALERLASRLEYLMQYDEQKLFQLVMHILDTSAKVKVPPQQRMEAEVQELKRHLEDTGPLDEHTERCIHAFIALLQMHLLPGVESDTQPYQLLDPLTLEFLRDPVVLLESGITYERRSLQEWLAKKGLQALVEGELVDPFTGVLLSKCPPDVCPNMSIRKTLLKRQQELEQRQAQGFSDAGSLLSRSASSGSASELAKLDPQIQKEALEQHDPGHTAHEKVPALTALLEMQLGLHLPAECAWKLALTLQSCNGDESPAEEFCQVLQLVEALQAKFQAADWRQCNQLGVPSAYFVMKQCGFGYLGCGAFRELCCLHFGDSTLTSVSLLQLLDLVATALFALWQEVRGASGGRSSISVQQLHAALIANPMLARLSMADVHNIVRYHSNSLEATSLCFQSVWELHSCLVELLTAFRGYDRTSSGQLKEDMVVPVLMHAGLQTVMATALRDSWRKVAPRQMQLSCSSVVALFYHLLNHYAHVCHHVRPVPDAGLRAGPTSPTSLRIGPGSPSILRPKPVWPFTAFWDSLHPGRILRGRYEIQRQLGLPSPTGGTCMAHDRGTGALVHIHFFFSGWDTAQLVAQELQLRHMVHVKERWEAGEDDTGVWQPAAIVSSEGMATLDSWLEQQKFKPSPLSERKELLGQVLEALADLEQANFVHLGLCPSNILFTWDPEAGCHRWKLAGLIHCITVGKEGKVATPLEYTAPELADCCGTCIATGVDGWGPHVWSMGVVAFRVLTGGTLFKDPCPSPWLVKGLSQKQLPTQLERAHLLHIIGQEELHLLEGMLQVTPEQRKPASVLLRDFFPQRFTPPDTDLLSPHHPSCHPFRDEDDHSVHVDADAAAAHAAAMAGQGAQQLKQQPQQQGVLQSWHHSARWALQPSAATIKEHLQQAQQQVKAYTAEVAFTAAGPAAFLWPKLQAPLPTQPVRTFSLLGPSSSPWLPTTHASPIKPSAAPSNQVLVAAAAAACAAVKLPAGMTANRYAPAPTSAPTSWLSAMLTSPRPPSTPLAAAGPAANPSSLAPSTPVHPSGLPSSTAHAEAEGQQQQQAGRNPASWLSSLLVSNSRPSEPSSAASSPRPSLRAAGVSKPSASNPGTPKASAPVLAGVPGTPNTGTGRGASMFEAGTPRSLASTPRSAGPQPSQAAQGGDAAAGWSAMVRWPWHKHAQSGSPWPAPGPATTTAVAMPSAGSVQHTAIAASAGGAVAGAHASTSKGLGVGGWVWGGAGGSGQLPRVPPLLSNSRPSASGKGSSYHTAHPATISGGSDRQGARLPTPSPRRPGADSLGTSAGATGETHATQPDASRFGQQDTHAADQDTRAAAGERHVIVDMWDVRPKGSRAVDTLQGSAADSYTSSAAQQDALAEAFRTKLKSHVKDGSSSFGSTPPTSGRLRGMPASPGTHTNDTSAPAHITAGASAASSQQQPPHSHSHVPNSTSSNLGMRLKDSPLPAQRVLHASASFRSAASGGGHIHAYSSWSDVPLDDDYTAAPASATSEASEDSTTSEEPSAWQASHDSQVSHEGDSEVSGVLQKSYSVEEDQSSEASEDVMEDARSEQEGTDVVSQAGKLEEGVQVHVSPRSDSDVSDRSPAKRVVRMSMKQGSSPTRAHVHPQAGHTARWGGDAPIGADVSVQRDQALRAL